MDNNKISLKRHVYLTEDFLNRMCSYIAMVSVVLTCLYFKNVGILSLLAFVFFFANFEWFGLWATSFNTSNPWNVSSLIGGLAYISGSLWCLQNLVFHQPRIFFNLLITVCLTDTFAYVIGNLFKKFEIYVSIENLGQGKTWPGVLGGIICSTVISYLIFVPLFQSEVLSRCFLISCATMCGDMLESYAKRSAMRKDSSSFLLHIPGHGGVLDRIDGLLLATFVAYYYKNF
jgi:CDP-diglyceride synthetase